MDFPTADKYLAMDCNTVINKYKNLQILKVTVVYKLPALYIASQYKNMASTTYHNHNMKVIGTTANNNYVKLLGYALHK